MWNARRSTRCPTGISRSPHFQTDSAAYPAKTEMRGSQIPRVHGAGMARHPEPLHQRDPGRVGRLDGGKPDLCSTRPLPAGSARSGHRPCWYWRPKTVLFSGFRRIGKLRQIDAGSPRSCRAGGVRDPKSCVKSEQLWASCRAAFCGKPQSCVKNEQLFGWPWQCPARARRFERLSIYDIRSNRTILPRNNESATGGRVCRSSRIDSVGLDASARTAARSKIRRAVSRHRYAGTAQNFSSMGEGAAAKTESETPRLGMVRKCRSRKTAQTYRQRPRRLESTAAQAGAQRGSRICCQYSAPAHGGREKALEPQVKLSKSGVFHRPDSLQISSTVFTNKGEKVFQCAALFPAPQTFVTKVSERKSGDATETAPIGKMAIEPNVAISVVVSGKSILRGSVADVARPIFAEWPSRYVNREPHPYNLAHEASYPGCGGADGIGARPGPPCDAGSDPARTIITRSCA